MKKKLSWSGAKHGAKQWMSDALKFNKTWPFSILSSKHLYYFTTCSNSWNSVLVSKHKFTNAAFFTLWFFHDLKNWHGICGQITWDPSLIFTWLVKLFCHHHSGLLCLNVQWQFYHSLACFACSVTVLSLVVLSSALKGNKGTTCTPNLSYSRVRA